MVCHRKCHHNKRYYKSSYCIQDLKDCFDTLKDIHEFVILILLWWCYNFAITDGVINNGVINNCIYYDGFF